MNAKVSRLLIIEEISKTVKDINKGMIPGFKIYATEWLAFISDIKRTGNTTTTIIFSISKPNASKT